MYFLHLRAKSCVSNSLEEHSCPSYLSDVLNFLCWECSAVPLKLFCSTYCNKRSTEVSKNKIEHYSSVVSTLSVELNGPGTATAQPVSAQSFHLITQKRVLVSPIFCLLFLFYYISILSKDMKHLSST